MKPLNLASILAALLLPVAANAQQAVFLVRHAELPGAAMADPKITRMTLTSEKPGGYWEDQGYPWLGGV